MTTLKIAIDESYNEADGNLVHVWLHPVDGVEADARPQQESTFRHRDECLLLGSIHRQCADTSGAVEIIREHEAELLSLCERAEHDYDGNGRLATTWPDCDDDTHETPEIARTIEREMERWAETAPTFWAAGDYLGSDWPTVMQGCDGTDEWFDEHADNEVEAALPSVRLDRAKVREYLVAMWRDEVLPKLLAEGVHVSNGHEVGNGFDAEAHVDDWGDLQVRVRDVSQGWWSGWADVKGREAKSLDDLRQVAIDAAGCPGDYVTWDVADDDCDDRRYQLDGSGEPMTMADLKEACDDDPTTMPEILALEVGQVVTFDGGRCTVKRTA